MQGLLNNSRDKRNSLFGCGVALFFNEVSVQGRLKMERPLVLPVHEVQLGMDRRGVHFMAIMLDESTEATDIEEIVTRLAGYCGVGGPFMMCEFGEKEIQLHPSPGSEDDFRNLKKSIKECAPILEALDLKEWVQSIANPGSLLPFSDRNINPKNHLRAKLSCHKHF